MKTLKSSRPKIAEAIVVEGKYDKTRLETVVDALIVVTDGFNLSHQALKLEYIRRLAASVGVIVLTDSDVAGFRIRAILGRVIPQQQLKHAYVPVIFGKERRKREPSKEGILGVEGMQGQVILQALKKAGATFVGQQTVNLPQALPITAITLFEDGLVGREGSRTRREELLKQLKLPPNISTKGLIKFLNTASNGALYKQALTALDSKLSTGRSKSS